MSLIFVLSSIPVFAEIDDRVNKSLGQGYPVDLYDSEVEKPKTYNSGSPFDGSMAAGYNTVRMLEEIERLNEMSKTEILKPLESKILAESIKLPELSSALGKEVLFRLVEGSEINTLPEGVTIEKLAEAIVEELFRITTMEEEEIVSEEIGSKKIAGSRNQREGNVFNVPFGFEGKVYEKELEFVQGAVTVAYLIFGDKMVIETPMILAENFEEKEARIARELEHMATLIEKIGRQD